MLLTLTRAGEDMAIGYALKGKAAENQMFPGSEPWRLETGAPEPNRYLGSIWNSRTVGAYGCM